MIRLYLYVTILLTSVNAIAQEGCTSSLADNFDSSAVIDDGSCLFNDNCTTAEPVSCGDTVSGSTLEATAGIELLAPVCGPSIDGPGVWYVIMGDGVNEITATTCGSAYDSRIHVFSGTCGAFVCEGGNDDSVCDGVNQLQSTVTWFGQAGVAFYVHVSGWNGSLGEFSISFTCDSPGCEPLGNDYCSAALSLINGVPHMGTNSCAYANDLQPACDPFAAIQGVWYVWNSGDNNSAILDFNSAEFPLVTAATEPALAMFSGTCGALEEIFCNDTDLPLMSQPVFGLEPQTDYYLLVWTDSDEDEGEFNLSVTGGISGCTIPGGCNYNPDATADDGSCDMSCLGCTNSSAINYSITAVTDDGSCIVAGCSETPETFSYCYENNDVVSFLFQENNPGERVTLEFLAGSLEENWDFIEIFDGEDNTSPSLTEGPISGDLAGLIVQSTGANLYVEIIADVSNSCGSGTSALIEADIYCGILAICGCMDPIASNYNPDATIECGCNYHGCTDPAACNYVPGALIDDGSCCLSSCTTVEITDSFGDGSGSFSLFDEDNNLLASGSLDDGEYISYSFCIPNGCHTLLLTEDAFPDEMGLTITSQDGLLYEEQVGNGIDSGPIVIDFGATGLCNIFGPNCGAPGTCYYLPSEYDCQGVLGGTDQSCCDLPIVNTCCLGSIPINAGVEYNWDTTWAYNSGYNCSPSLVYDAWYSYTPSCDMVATISSASAFGGELAVWQGDCEGEGLTLVQCAPNNGFIEVSTEVQLTGGTEYFIQTGTNSTFGANGSGTLEIIEGGCQGCVYSFSPNYDPQAVVDNGSCLEPLNDCAGDFNGDGAITSSDLTGFLGVYGSLCE